MSYSIRIWTLFFFLSTTRFFYSWSSFLCNFWFCFLCHLSCLFVYFSCTLFRFDFACQSLEFAALQFLSTFKLGFSSVWIYVFIWCCLLFFFSIFVEFHKQNWTEENITEKNKRNSRLHIHIRLCSSCFLVRIRMFGTNGIAL